MLPAFQSQEYFKRAMEILGDEWAPIFEEMDPKEIAARFVTMALPELFNDRLDEKPPRIAVPHEERAPRSSAPPRGGRGDDRRRSSSPPTRRRDSSRRGPRNERGHHHSARP